MGGSVLAGALLAALAVYGVVSSQTAAPKNNPVSSQVVDYGNR
jgi:hypothetical protein